MSTKSDKTFFEMVPLALDANLEYRIKVRERCAIDTGFREATQLACKSDVLYWLSTFAWIYEPRPRKVRGKTLPNIIPFIPWVHQVPVIRELEEKLGYEDVTVEKSRGEGVSWCGVLMAVRDWIYDPMTKIGLVSRNMETADSPDDPDSLMWKVVWELGQLPIWMVGHKDVDWKRTIDDSTLKNLRNGSIISAYAATADVGRGGRCKWFLMDELGAFKRGDDVKAVNSTLHTTDSRLFVSTPYGSDGVYYDIVCDARVKGNLLSMHWSQNPSKNRGLYRMVKGKVVEIDPVSNPLPPNYEEDSREMFTRLRSKGFNLEKVDVRSPWYDLQCDRPGATPTLIAQELDLDYAGSQHLVFNEDFLSRAQETVRPASIKGQFTLHPETHELIFDRTWDGQVELWTELDHRKKPPRGEYVVSADISSGMGGSYTSNSVCEVINLLTMEQVLEFATNTVSPSDFADICIGVAEWFYGAYLSWEINGPGAAFTRRVLDRQYGHVYRRTVLWKTGRKKIQEVGWHTGEKSKPVMFAEFQRIVMHREFTVRSRSLVTECKQYIIDSTGKIEHQVARTSQDNSVKGQQHGDRVIAIGVGIQAAKDRPSVALGASETEQSLEDRIANAPPGTPAARMRESMENDRLKSDPDGWDDRTNGELTSLTFSLTRHRRDWVD